MICENSTSFPWPHTVIDSDTNCLSKTSRPELLSSAQPPRALTPQNPPARVRQFTLQPTGSIRNACPPPNRRAFSQRNDLSLGSQPLDTHHPRRPHHVHHRVHRPHQHLPRTPAHPSRSPSRSSASRHRRRHFLLGLSRLTDSRRPSRQALESQKIHQCPSRSLVAGRNWLWPGPYL